MPPEAGRHSAQLIRVGWAEWGWGWANQEWESGSQGHVVWTGIGGTCQYHFSHDTLPQPGLLTLAPGK